MHTDDPFKDWNHLSQEEQINAINVLELQPGRRLDALRAILKSSWKARWPFAVQAIRAMGYPQNASALPELMIDQIGDRNSQGWEEAVQTVSEMPRGAVIKTIVNVLFDKGRTISSWDSVVEGVCTMLKKVGIDYILLCVPVIIYLLSKSDLPGELDKTMLLDILIDIPMESIIYYLPILLDMAESYDKTTNVGADVRILLSRFGEDMLAPYQQIIENTMGEVSDS